MTEIFLEIWILFKKKFYIYFLASISLASTLHTFVIRAFMLIQAQILREIKKNQVVITQTLAFFQAILAILH